MSLFNLKKEEPKTFDLKEDIKISTPQATKPAQDSSKLSSMTPAPAVAKVKPEVAKKPAKQEESGNVYTNIFEKPTTPKNEELKSDIITGVFAKEAKEAKKQDNILGPIPELQTKLTGSYDPSKKTFKLAMTLFISLACVSLAILGFFYAEMNPKFDLLAGIRGPNTIQRLNNSRTDIITMQTAINQKNYLLLNFYLQQLSYLSDSYSTARSVQGVKSTTDLQSNILLTYENALSVWKEPKTASRIPEQTFTDELKKTLSAELAKLKKEDQTDLIKSQIKDYENTINLINNKKLATFFNKNTDDIKADLPLDDTKLYALTTEALSTLNNEFSVLSNIKSTRMHWAEIVNEIEKATKNVDTLYNTGFYEELGGIQYNSYDFNAKSGKIIISGKVKKDDGSTFSLIANLIDALEKSDMFVNVDNRSYPKSGSEDEGYTSSFRIEFNIQTDGKITNPLT